VFPKIGGKPAKWMVKIMEIPVKMDDLGGNPPFSETPIVFFYIDPLHQTLPFGLYPTVFAMGFLLASHESSTCSKGYNIAVIFVATPKKIARKNR